MTTRQLLKAGDLEGAALAASDLDAQLAALRLRGEGKPDGLPVAVWKAGALRSLVRVCTAALAECEG